MVLLPLDDAPLQAEQKLARLFRRECFYINASKLVKEAAVDGVEKGELGGD